MKVLIKILIVVLIVSIISGINDYVSYALNVDAALSIIILGISLSVIFLCALYFGGFFRSNESRVFLIVFCGFLVLAAISTVMNSSNHEFSWGFRYYLPSLIIYFSGFFGFRFFTKFGNWLSLINVFRFALLINVLTIVISFFFNYDWLVVRGDRASGINLNANSAGFVAVISFCFELFHLAKGNYKWGILFISLVLIGLFVTFSKSAFIMAIGVMFLYITHLKRQSNGFRYFARLGVFSLILFLGFTLFSGLFENLSAIQSQRINELTAFLSGEVSAETTTNRSDLFNIGWNKIQKSPLIGLGFKEMSVLGHNINGVHNQYLLLWGEGGVVSMLLYLFLIFYFYKKAGKLPNDYRFLLRSILLAIFLYSMTNHNMYSNKGLMLYLAFLVLVFYKFRYVRNFRTAGVR